MFEADGLILPPLFEFLLLSRTKRVNGSTSYRCLWSTSYYVFLITSSNENRDAFCAGAICDPLGFFRAWFRAELTWLRFCFLAWERSGLQFAFDLKFQFYRWRANVPTFLGCTYLHVWDFNLNTIFGCSDFILFMYIYRWEETLILYRYTRTCQI